MLKLICLLAVVGLAIGQPSLPGIYQFLRNCKRTDGWTYLTTEPKTCGTLKQFAQLCGPGFACAERSGKRDCKQISLTCLLKYKKSRSGATGGQVVTSVKGTSSKTIPAGKPEISQVVADQPQVVHSGYAMSRVDAQPVKVVRTDTVPVPTVKPAVVQPAVQPTVVQPAVQPTVVQPAVQPTVVQPAVQPTVVQPAVQPTVVQPAVQPTVVQPAVQPTVVQPAVQPTMVKPAVGQPVAVQPRVVQPATMIGGGNQRITITIEGGTAPHTHLQPQPAVSQVVEKPQQTSPVVKPKVIKPEVRPVLVRPTPKVIVEPKPAPGTTTTQKPVVAVQPRVEPPRVLFGVDSQPTRKTAVATGACVDKHTNCCFWAQAGECLKNPFYMRTKCALACGTCGCKELNALDCKVTVNGACKFATQAPTKEVPGAPNILTITEPSVVRDRKVAAPAKTMPVATIPPPPPPIRPRPTPAVQPTAKPLPTGALVIDPPTIRPPPPPVFIKPAVQPTVPPPPPTPTVVERTVRPPPPPTPKVEVEPPPPVIAVQPTVRPPPGYVKPAVQPARPLPELIVEPPPPVIAVQPTVRPPPGIVKPAVQPTARPAPTVVQPNIQRQPLKLIIEIQPEIRVQPTQRQVQTLPVQPRVVQPAVPTKPVVQTLPVQPRVQPPVVQTLPVQPRVQPPVVQTLPVQPRVQPPVVQTVSSRPVVLPNVDVKPVVVSQPVQTSVVGGTVPVAAGQPQQTSVPLTATGCADTHQSCTYWASIGECDKNPFWMKPKCPKSCSFCGKTVADVNRPQPKPGCTDKHDLCQFWKTAGECEKNHVWMPTNCALSCGTC